MKKRLLFSLLLATALPASAAYTGRIFVDKNKNGLYDKGETLLKGVRVSDGLHVTSTASDGTFSLPGHERERFIFITTPSGYKTFNKHYRKIEAATSQYDFGLLPGKTIRKEGAHSFIQIADTEIFNTENHSDWINNVRDYAANEEIAFIIHTGDICYEKGLNAHIKLMNTENMDCPVFYCIGNHDLVDGKYGEELFESIYGPVYYSFEAGNVHYIVTPMPDGDRTPGYTNTDVCRWLKNDLANVKPGTPVIVFNHDLLTNDDAFIYKGENGESVNLNEHNLKAWLYGHWHINYMKKHGNVYSISTSTLDKGGIDHSTNTFRVLHIDPKGGLSSELRYTYLDKQIKIASQSAGITASGRIPVMVNAYSSVSPVKEVVFTCLADGKPVVKNKAMQQATDWCWTAELPSMHKYEGKQLTLQAKARFNNGETAETEAVFAGQTAPEVKLEGDWTNLLGNATHTAPDAPQLDAPLQLAWVKNIGANIYMTSPLVYKGNIYVASVDENLKGEGYVCAIDGKSGSIRWKYAVRNSIKNTIAIDNGKVFAQDVQGILYALDATTGELCWQQQLPVKGLPAIIEGLTADNGIVYAGTGKGLCALDSRNGNRIWKNEDWGQGEGTTSTPTLGNGLLICGAQWSGLYGNDARTGKMLWEAKENGLRNRGASPALHGSLLYLISDKSFFILEATTGKVVVRKPLPYNVDVTSTPLLTDKEIIFGTAERGLVALDRETLEEKWNYQTGNSLVFTSPYSRKPASTIETSPVLAGNTVYVGASDGVIYGIDKASGKQVWKHETGAPVFGSVAISGNTLVAVDLGGNVYTFCTNAR